MHPNKAGRNHQALWAKQVHTTNTPKGKPRGTPALRHRTHASHDELPVIAKRNDVQNLHDQVLQSNRRPQLTQQTKHQDVKTWSPVNANDADVNDKRALKLYV